MVDRYTKAVLTVIAAALLALMAQNGMSASRAQEMPANVELCSNGGLNCGDVDGAGAIKV